MDREKFNWNESYIDNYCVLETLAIIDMAALFLTSCSPCLTQFSKKQWHAFDMLEIPFFGDANESFDPIVIALEAAMFFYPTTDAKISAKFRWSFLCRIEMLSNNWVYWQCLKLLQPRGVAIIVLASREPWVTDTVCKVESKQHLAWTPAKE